MLKNSSKVEDFLTRNEEEEIIEAIRSAERNTSGEIRVHLETSCEGDAVERAVKVFDFLHMNNTRFGNGVLIYVAVEDRSMVILGDEGINKAVPNNFWESTKDTILAHFKNGAIKKGLVMGIHEAGEQLKAHFPYRPDDRDELSNEISTG